MNTNVVEGEDIVIISNLEIVKALDRDEILLKLERQLDKSKTLMEDKQEMAIQGEALFDETQTNC
jgi:hypothetical protein